MCGPQQPWRCPLVRHWFDAVGCKRGSVHLEAALATEPASLEERIAFGYLGPGTHGVRIVRWEPHGVTVLDESSIIVGTWLLSRTQTGWGAARVGPFGGAQWGVLFINHEDPVRWCADRWYCAGLGRVMGCIVLLAPSPVWGDLVRPTSAKERKDLMRRGRNSRPGRSGFKLALLALCPKWMQDAYWQLVDTQRACAIIAGPNKVADQLNIPKPGGWRPLTMLEESLKAIEGPVARRICRHVMAMQMATSTHRPTLQERRSVALQAKCYTLTPWFARTVCATHGPCAACPRTMKSSSIPLSSRRLTQLRNAVASPMERGPCWWKPSAICGSSLIADGVRRL